jgi:peptidoglycan/LPS O-acetylase OafA/YrhL
MSSVLASTVGEAPRAPSTAGFKSGMGHIPSLDGVRALAFLMVFVSHGGLKNLVPGGFGVTIFFVLSGFLITTLLRVEYETNGWVDLGAFYLRRVCRIFPLLYITIAACVVLRLMGQLGGDLTLAGVLSQVLQWSNYYLIAHGPDSVIAGTIVLWSLAVEESFYLLFPIIYRALSKRFSAVTQGWILALACGGCLLWRLVLVLVLHRPYVRTELGADTRFDSLLLGCLMAIVANPARDMPPWMTLKRIQRAALLSIPVLLFTFLYRDEAFRYTWRFTLQSVAVLPLFAYAIKDHESIVFRTLNSRWMVHMGILSYALYLVHSVILEWFTQHLHASKLTSAIVALAVAILVAKILQVTVERPILKLRRQFAVVRTSGA